MEEPGDLTPRPDPTERTREELLREVEHLRTLIEAQLKGHKDFATTRHADLLELVTQRIDATERHFDLHLNEARHQLQDAIEAERRQTEAALVATTSATEAALESATKAVDKAEQATEERFRGVNAFRDQLREQSQTFLRVDMFDQHVREARESIQTLQTQTQANAAQLLAISSSETGGKDREAQARANIASALAFVATLVAVVTLVMTLTT